MFVIKIIKISLIIIGFILVSIGLCFAYKYYKYTKEINAYIQYDEENYDVYYDGDGVPYINNKLVVYFKDNVSVADAKDIVANEDIVCRVISTFGNNSRCYYIQLDDCYRQSDLLKFKERFEQYDDIDSVTLIYCPVVESTN